MKEAKRNHVLPIDDRRSERFNPAIAGRPDLLNGRKTLTVYHGMTGMHGERLHQREGRAPHDHGRSRGPGCEGERRDHRAGRLLRRLDAVHEGRHACTQDYNYFGLDATNVASKTALAPGKHTIVYEFIPDEAKPGTGGKSILSVDGKDAAEGHIPKTQPFAFSADEGVDVGVDGETNVSDDYKQGDNKFTGQIVKVTVAQL